MSCPVGSTGALKRRHRATPFLDNLVLLVPHPDWVASLPDGKLPDRNDFMRLDEATRQAHWRRAVLESARLAEAFDALTRQPRCKPNPPVESRLPSTARARKAPWL